MEKILILMKGFRAYYDAFGNPLDDKPLERMKEQWPLMGKSMNPLKENQLQN